MQVTESHGMPNCGIPWTIKDNTLKYMVTISAAGRSVDSSAFSQFEYADGKYIIGNDGCVCNGIGWPFNVATEGCRCAFRVDGEPLKRAFTFERYYSRNKKSGTKGLVTSNSCCVEIFSYANLSCPLG